MVNDISIHDKIYDLACKYLGYAIESETAIAIRIEMMREFGDSIISVDHILESQYAGVCNPVIRIKYSVNEQAFHFDLK